MKDKDMFENEWAQMNTPEAEMKQIRRSIRNKNLKIISLSVLLAAALMWICINLIIPAAEAFYWNPYEITHGSNTDLDVTLHAYTELFTPGYNTFGASYRHSGFAGYDLEVQVHSTARNQIVSAKGALKKNILSMDQQFFTPMNKYYPFVRQHIPDYTPYAMDIDALRQRLSALPEYIRLEATIEFPSDLSMEELMTFREEQSNLLITWVAVRCAEASEPIAPLLGMDPFTGGGYYDGFLMTYRYFSASQISEPAHLAQHFKSRLQYYIDQLEKGQGFYRYDTQTLNNILTYVEENGVYCYGCVAAASPQTLLALLDEGIVCNITPVDCWIDISG